MFLENRPVVIVLNDAKLIEILMNHLVEKGVTKIVSSFVQVDPDVDGGRIRVVTEIPPTPSKPYWDDVEQSVEVLVVELVKPHSEET